MATHNIIDCTYILEWLTRPIYTEMRPVIQDMATHPGANRLDFGLGDQAARARALLPSNSVESLPGNEKQPSKKVNAFALTRKLNGKIQAIASKQTEIFVWTRKVAECTVENVPLSLYFHVQRSVHGFVYCRG